MVQGSAGPRRRARRRHFHRITNRPGAGGNDGMNSYLFRLALLSLGALALAVPAARAADAKNAVAPGAPTDWPQWRGPNFNGTSDAKNLPTEFGKDKNVLWKTTLPGGSNNTPIICGGRVYTTSIDASRKMTCLCLDLKTGKILWQKDAGISQIRPKGENDVASPSPVTDGKSVYFLFGTGDLL